MNNWNGIGRVTRDIELKYTPSGVAIANFSIAVDRGMSKAKKEEIEQKGGQTADFINIVCFSHTAEFAANYLAKGLMVGISGRLQSGKYEKDGRIIYTTDVNCNEITMIEWKDKKESATEGFKPVDDVGDIPF